MKTITAILTVYKRVDYLEKQIQSLLDQTVKIDKFIINVNLRHRKDTYMEIINRLIPNALIVENSENLGVWSRFFLWFNCNTDFVFVIDDDIIPWPWYLENCMKCFEEKRWIYWSWWCRFKSLQVRQERKMITESNNIPSEITEVDMSWHSWFFPRDYLPVMFNRLPDDLEKYKVCWEELWISYITRKHYWIPTYIPPMNNRHITWNLEPKLGIDSNANYNSYWKTLYQDFYIYALNHWFVPLKFRDEFEYRLYTNT